MKRKVIVCLLAVVCLWSHQACAGNDAQLKAAQEALDYTLTSFRDSVDRLTKENKEMIAANDVLRLKLKALQEQLRLVKAEEARILGEYDNLNARYQKKAPVVQSLQVQYAGTAETLEVLKNDRAALEAEIENKENEEVVLVSKIGVFQKEIDSIQSGPSPEVMVPVERAALLQEKERLEKELVELSDRVEKVRGEWQGLSAVVNGGPEQVKVFQNDQLALQKEIVLQEKEIAELKDTVLKEGEFLSQMAAVIVDASSVAELEQKTQALSADYGKVQKEVSALEKAVDDQGKKLLEEKTSRQKKQEDAFKEAMGQNKKLRDEVNRLRRDMISLDKKKTGLEKEVY